MNQDIYQLDLMNLVLKIILPLDVWTYGHLIMTPLQLKMMGHVLISLSNMSGSVDIQFDLNLMVKQCSMFGLVSLMISKEHFSL